MTNRQVLVSSSTRTASGFSSAIVLGSSDNIVHYLVKIGAHRIQIQFRIIKAQIFKEHTIQVIFIVLPSVDMNRNKVLAALLYYSS